MKKSMAGLVLLTVAPLEVMPSEIEGAEVRAQHLP
jgi:hypothetical protein